MPYTMYQNCCQLVFCLSTVIITSSMKAEEGAVLCTQWIFSVQFVLCVSGQINVYKELLWCMVHTIRWLYNNYAQPQPHMGLHCFHVGVKAFMCCDAVWPVSFASCWEIDQLGLSVSCLLVACWTASLLRHNLRGAKRDRLWSCGCVQHVNIHRGLV